MKIVVQIPCYNEEKTLAKVVKGIPRRIRRCSVAVLVVDDGSSDKTSQIAKKAGVEKIVRNKKNLGLAKAFCIALKESLDMGADIVVNIDGDDQYETKEIQKLVDPILNDEADMVIGDRQVKGLKHMPTSKRLGNILGSWTIRKLTGANVQDASSGFRAFSRTAALSFNLNSTHTYTHETIIQATGKDMIIKEVPIVFKKRKYGESRLIKGIWSHIQQSAITIIRTILMYKSFRYIFISGILFIALGVAVGFRFIYFFAIGEGSGHTQSLVLSSILISLGANTVFVAIVADLVSINRKLADEIRNTLKE